MEAASTSVENHQNNILTAVPETLKKLTLYLTRIFYGLEHYVIMYYVQENVILKEEQIRDLCKMEQRLFRQIVALLKVDKFLKERLVSEEVDGKNRKTTYYFVDYKSLLNVTKYKIDHMRQKLETKDKESVSKESYSCTNDSCNRKYDAMDVGRIYDPFSQEMRCWQCSSLVSIDEAAGPSRETRSSLAKFNDQMAPIFRMLKEMNGVKFSREILEPPVPTVSAPREDTDATKNVGRIVSTIGKTRTELYSGGITVSIGAGVDPSNTLKPEVPWLQNRQHNNEPTTSNHMENGFLNLDFDDEPRSNSIFDLPDIVVNGDFLLNGVASKKQYNKFVKLEEEPEDGQAKEEEIAQLLREVEGI